MFIIGALPIVLKYVNMSLELFKLTQKGAFSIFLNDILYFFIFKLLPRSLALIWFTYMYAVLMNLNILYVPL